MIGVGALVLGLGIGAAGGSADEGAGKPTTTRVTSTVTASPEVPTETVTIKPTPATITKKIKVTPRPKAVISGDGTFLVGKDIRPGTYRNRDGGDCYWARLSGTSGDFSEILANNNTSGQAIVTILPTDKALDVQDCGDWTKVG